MGVGQVVASLDLTAGLAEQLRDGTALLAYGLLVATTAPPLVPNATLLVTAGVLAAQGRLNILLVLLVVAGSALLGDMLIHRTGHAMSGPALHRVYRRPRRRALLGWASSRIQRHGVPFVVGVRFLPSGRLIGGLAAGIVRYPACRYLVGAGIAEAVWASYSVGLGYFGGLASSNPLYAGGIGIGVSLLVAAAGGLVQWTVRRRSGQQPPGSAAADGVPSAARTGRSACDGVRGRCRAHRLFCSSARGGE